MTISLCSTKKVQKVSKTLALLPYQKPPKYISNKMTNIKVSKQQNYQQCPLFSYNDLSTKEKYKKIQLGIPKRKRNPKLYCSLRGYIMK